MDSGDSTSVTRVMTAGVGPALGRAIGIIGKVVSPTVEQQLRAFDVAQVMVVLAPETAAAASTATTAATRIAPEVADRVRRHFRTSPQSQAVQLYHSIAGTRLASARAARTIEPPAAEVYPHLGVMLGTVDRQGLAELEADPEVLLVCGTPQISLIRPGRARPAKAITGTTWGIDMLGVPALWKQGLTGKGIKVGHLDTGVDGKHPTLKSALAGFAEFEPVMGRRLTPDPAPHDSDDHGTHTAATAVGRPTAGRSIGVAPEADLFSALVIEGGNVVARVLGGLDWAIASGVKIIAMSLGFRGFWEDFIPIVGIIKSRNILPIFAVGNEGPGTSRSPGNYPEALSVGAIDEARAVATFSSSQRFARRDEPVVPDLVAPGVNIVSAQPGNRFQAMDGTSMATPHVAGLAALLWQAKPGATANEIEAAMFGSCLLSPATSPERANRGFPNAASALARLTGTTLPSPGGRTRTDVSRKAASRKASDRNKRSRKRGAAKK